MEKRTSHYKLQDIKAAVAARGRLAFTRSAREGAEDMGLTVAESLIVIAGLAPHNCRFYKAMTTHANHHEWQDVYHADTPSGRAYLKFTLRDGGAIVISFKRLES